MSKLLLMCFRPVFVYTYLRNELENCLEFVNFNYTHNRRSMEHLNSFNQWGLRPGLKLRKVGHINGLIPLPFIVKNNLDLPAVTVEPSYPKPIEIETFDEQCPTDAYLIPANKELEIKEEPELTIPSCSPQPIQLVAAQPPRIDYQILELQQYNPAKGLSTVIYKIPMTAEDQQDSLKSILNDLINSERVTSKSAPKHTYFDSSDEEDDTLTGSITSDYESGDKTSDSTDRLDKSEFVGRINHDCRICNDSFATTVLRFEHENEAHRDPITNRFKCPQCDEQNKSIFVLQGHIGRHNGFVCDICGKMFATKIYLKTHQIVHVNVSTFECHICPKAFKDKYKLNRHLERHTDRRPYQCDLCEKTYKDYTDLKRHKYSHGGVIPKFVCSFCGKRFFENKYLKKHTQIHLKMVKVEKAVQ